MSGLPYMRLYWDDLTANTYHMTPEAFGAYLRLLGYQWSNGSVPKNPKRLRTITGVDPADWPEVWEQIGDKFEAAGEGAMRNARLEKERKEGEELRQKKIKAGKEGARRRWQTDSTPIGTPNSKPNSGPNGSGDGITNSNPQPRSLSNDRDHGEGAEIPAGSHARGGQALARGEEEERATVAVPLEVIRAELDGRKEPAAETLAFQFHSEMESTEWTSRSGEPIRNWRAFLTWWLKNSSAAAIHRRNYKPPLPSNAVSEEELAEMRAIREQRKAKKGQP